MAGKKLGRLRWEVIAQLIQENEYQTFVELGVQRGRNLFGVLGLCPHLRVVGVDLWDSIPSKVGAKREWHRSNWHRVQRGVKQWHAMFGVDKIFLITDETAQAAQHFGEGEFDMVFVDADHSYAGVKADIEAWAPKIRKGGMICGHDYGHDKYPDVKKAVDDLFGQANVTTFEDKVWAVTL